MYKGERFDWEYRSRGADFSMTYMTSTGARNVGIPTSEGVPFTG